MDMVTYTCFGCFAECTAPPPVAGTAVYCPLCGKVVAVGSDEGPGQPAVDFGVTDQDRQAMTRRRVEEAYAAEAASDALLRGVIRGIP